ncbi:MAG: sodium:solute symporter [Dysgonamonadaceae bacterium]|jgi:Na+/proline symporter|nr:sodium:solute symporter [Dysgonamonadaceae bacterium]
MSPLLILAVVAAYFISIFVISRITGRKADNQSFFTGNRKSSWVMVTFAMIGAAISGVTFVSVPGMVAAKGFSYMEMVIGFTVGQLIIAFVLIPLFYKMNLTSIYEYLENRFGMSSYKTGAWFFFISKMLGAAVRLYLVCAVMQLLVIEPFLSGMAEKYAVFAENRQAFSILFFIVNVVVSMALVWLYTNRGGVKTLIWTDSFKTLCLVVSVILSIYFIAKSLGFNLGGLVSAVAAHDYSQIFFFDDINDKRHFVKQFLAGVFTLIAMTGLDQDMMQKNMSCKNPADAKKNIVITALLQAVVIFLFLVLGVLLYMFAAKEGIAAKGDDLFPKLATGGYFPAIVGILFILGFISAAYAAAGSALTALTTSFTVDILESSKKDTETETTRRRKAVHIWMSVVMGIVILVIKALNNTSVIDAVYILASYTYGPILGMFAFGIFAKWQVRDRWVPLVALLSPALCLVLDLNSRAWFGGYQFSYELLLMNAAFTFVGLLVLRKK